MYIYCIFWLATAGTNILLPASPTFYPSTPNPLPFPAEHGFLNQQMKKQKRDHLSQTTWNESLFEI